MGSDFDFRWGIPEYDDYNKGSVWIPGFIMRHYAKLGIQGREFELIAQLASFKYNTPKGDACPAQVTIAERMGFKGTEKSKVKAVARIIKSLEDKDLLRVIRRTGQTSSYNFALLAEKCLVIEKQEIEEREKSTLPQNDTPPQIGESTPPQIGETPPHKLGGEEREVIKRKEERESKTTPPSDPDASASFEDDSKKEDQSVQENAYHVQSPELKEGIAAVCYPNLEPKKAVASNAAMIVKALKKIKSAAPEMLSPAGIQAWSEWWWSEDFRGVKGIAPEPKNIIETWLKFYNWHKGGGKSTQGQPGKKSQYGQHKGVYPPGVKIDIPEVRPTTHLTTDPETGKVRKEIFDGFITRRDGSRHPA